MPSKNKNSENNRTKIITNEWYDLAGNQYKLLDDILFITANDYFCEDGYSIIDYINQLPNNLSVVLKIKLKPNNVAGYNMLFNRLSVFPVNKNVIVDMSTLSFSEKMAIDIEKLPDNVKITSLLYDSMEEKDEFSNESFESWSLNCSDQNFGLLITKLTLKTAQRIFSLRKIALNFYMFAPNNIKNGTNEDKIKFAYKWCCDNIEYDITATEPDGSLKFDRKDSQEPILTFKRRKGVCVGRTKLLKALLNNCYKIYCIHGMKQ